MKKNQAKARKRTLAPERNPVPVKDCLFKKTANQEGLVVHLGTGDYYVLNDSALRVWQAMNGKTPSASIAQRIAKAYRISGERAGRDVKKCLASFKRAKLIAG